MVRYPFPVLSLGLDLERRESLGATPQSLRWRQYSLGWQSVLHLSQKSLVLTFWQDLLRVMLTLLLFQFYEQSICEKKEFSRADSSSGCRAVLQLALCDCELAGELILMASWQRYLYSLISFFSSSILRVFSLSSSLHVLILASSPARPPLLLGVQASSSSSSALALSFRLFALAAFTLASVSARQCVIYSYFCLSIWNLVVWKGSMPDWLMFKCIAVRSYLVITIQIEIG